MPIPGARFRVKTTKTGKRVRLAFKGGKVVEAKNIDTGDVHTPADFARDRKRRSKKRAKKVRRVGMKKKIIDFVRRLRKK